MIKNILGIIFLFTLVLASYAESNIYKNVFDIPAYPGTVSFKSYQSDLAVLNPPFATSLKVFKTKDGSSFRKEDVIRFYKEYYEGRGWQKGIAERQGDEPYLGLRVQVYEPDGAQTQIHVAGTLYLWVAPQDGMLTVYMHQWRISSLKQSSQDLYKKIEETLKKTSGGINYSILQAYTYSDWEEFYKNEYLVDCKKFTLFSESNLSRGSDIDETGRIHATLLAYRDSAVAQEQAKEFERVHVYDQRIIVQRDNILVLLENRDESQTNIVSRIAQELKSQEKRLPNKSMNHDKQ